MKLKLNELVVNCILGDLPEERIKEQKIYIDVELDVDDKVAKSDDLKDGVDYASLAVAIRERLIAGKYRLLERAADEVVAICLQYEKVKSARVEVSKFGAVDGLNSASAIASGTRDFPEYELAGIETIARGVCIRDGKLLLCRAKGAKTTYLPGGHIEFGESGRDALTREMEEEAGVAIGTKAFLGCVENSFLQHGKPHAEINLVYEMTIATRDVIAKESHIEFLWQPLSALATANLLPADFLQLENGLTHFSV